MINFKTKNYLNSVRTFAKDVVLPAEGQTQEAGLVYDRAVNHFCPKMMPLKKPIFWRSNGKSWNWYQEFKNYKVEKKGLSIVLEDVFHIEPLPTKPLFRCLEKKIKNVINLRTPTFRIKLDFINRNLHKKFVGKGLDEDRQSITTSLF